MAKPPQSTRTQPRETTSAPSRDLAALPERVRAMRELILEAVESGDIEDLRRPIERNETLPIFATGAERPRTFADVVGFLKAQSFDAQSRETLAIIAAIFDQAYAKITRGPVVTYEWPAFAARSMGEAGDEERREMWRCVRFADFASSSDKAPAIERIGIGADGTWHYFVANS
ncbi:MAG: hypothetical protein Q8M31_11700 [Beijerinckiaceae bacterium]|nr:hypothetical protein [Beijerinckiaceae bacterium]